MTAHSADFELLTWDCFDDKYSKKIIIQLVAEPLFEEGTVKIGGTKIDVEYQLKGLKRRWDWGEAFDSKGGGVLPYSIIMKPNGWAGYYDFTTESGTISSSMTVFCKQTKLEEKP